MKRILFAGVYALVTLMLACGLAIATIRQGIVTPPEGSFDLGPLSFIGARPCPQVWPPIGWSRPCGNDIPWIVQAVIHWPRGAVSQYELVRLPMRH